MQIDPRIKNIVLVGQFKVHDFDKFFFIKNKIVEEAEILPNSVFNAINGVQLNSKKFQIVISVNQIIITAATPATSSNKINEIISTILQAGNVAGITAAGFNFHYYAFDNTIPIEKLSKKLFYNDKIELISKYFNSEDARYGLYTSTNYKDARLKLEVKPSTISNITPGNLVDLIAFIFNFHFDLKNKPDNSDFLRYLSEYDSYLTESEKIISLYR